MVEKQKRLFQNLFSLLFFKSFSLFNVCRKTFEKMAKDDDNGHDVKIEKLTSTNYRTWKRVIKNWLIGKGDYEFVIGEELRPTGKEPNLLAEMPIPNEVSDFEEEPLPQEVGEGTPEPIETNAARLQRLIRNAKRAARKRDRDAIIDAHRNKTNDGDDLVKKQKEWDRRAGKLNAILLSNISVDIRGDVDHCETPHQIWKTLQEIYEEPNVLSKNDIIDKIVSYKFKKGDDSDKYFAKFTELFLIAKDAGATLDNDSKNIYLLRSLPNSMKDNWVSSYLGKMPPQQNPAKTIHDIKAQLRFLHMDKEDSDDEPHNAYYTRGRGGGRGRGRGRGGSGGGKRDFGRNYTGCYKCGEMDHKSRDCPTKKKSKDEDVSISDAERRVKELQEHIRKNKEKDKKRNRDSSQSPEPSKRRKDTGVTVIRPAKKASMVQHNPLSYENEWCEGYSWDSDDEDHQAYHTGPQHKSREGFGGWTKDCGASDHMTGNRSEFIDYQPVAEDWVYVGDGHPLRIEGIGSVMLQPRMEDGSVKKLILTDVLYVPKLKANLISSIKLAQGGYTTILHGCPTPSEPIRGTVIDTKTQETVFHVTGVNGMYTVDLVHHRKVYIADHSKAEEIPDDSTEPDDTIASPIDAMQSSISEDSSSDSQLSKSDTSTSQKKRKRRRRSKKSTPQKRQRNRKSRDERHSNRYRKHPKRHSSSFEHSTDWSDVFICDSDVCVPEYMYLSDEMDVSQSEETTEQEESREVLDQEENQIHQAFPASAPRPITTRESLKNFTKCEHDHETTKLEEIVWHHRLAHPHQNLLKKLGYLQAKEKAQSVSKTLKDPTIEYRCCKTCVEGRGTRIRTKRTAGRRCSDILQMVHMDTAGKITPECSRHHYKYYVVLVDDHSRYVTIAYLRKKSDAVPVIKQYKNVVENLTGKSIQRFKSDNGTKFCNETMDELCRQSGIVHEKSAPYTSRQAGVSERSIRTVTTKAKCMMFTAGAPKHLWDLAIQHAAYLMNRLPHDANPDGKSPYEMWNGDGCKPNLSNLKVWGCNAYAILDKTKRDGKFAKNALRCCFVGMDQDSNNYLLYNPKTKRVFATVDVVFDEADFSVMESIGVKPNGLGIDSKSSWLHLAVFILR